MRERPKIEWDFEQTGFVVNPGQRVEAGERSYYLNGIYLNGENISGHSIHQMEGEIILQRDGRRLPLFISGPNGWRRMGDLITLPPRREFTVGADFRADLDLHWPGFANSMTPDQFLTSIGGFTINIIADGEKRTWNFSIDEIRRQLDNRKAAAEETWLSQPMNIPQSTFRE